MKLKRQQLFEARSRQAPVPVVRMEIAVHPDEVSIDDGRSRAAARRLGELFPAIPSRRDLTEPAPPLFPEDRPFGPDEMVAYVALALQREFGFDVGFARGFSPAAPGTLGTCYQYSDPVTGLLAGQVAVGLVDGARSEEPDATGPGRGSRLTALHAKGMGILKQHALTQLTRQVVWECERRNVPWSRIHASQSFVQMGHGRNRRRFVGGYTGDTSYIATMLATSKLLAGELLRSHGIPAPPGIPVLDAEAAVAAARRLGYPVVLKPEHMDKGVGVSINLNDERDVRAAFEAARSYGPALVERQIPGDDHRITLFQGRMVAAVRIVAARVIGDGRSTIEGLIETVNRDPRRREQDYCPMSPIAVDREIVRTLEGQNLTLGTIPDEGRIIPLRRWWRQAKDHSVEDVTGIVHPDNRLLFERAARLIGLDIAGVDFITPDIRRPWTEVGGAVNEVNPTPNLMAHVRAGAPDIIPMFVDQYFPAGDDGRMPTAIIAGTAGAARGVATLLGRAGHTVGLATSEGVEVGEAVVTRNDSSGPAGARTVLGDPATSAAVLQVSSRGIGDGHLGLDEARVVAVMNLATGGDSAADPPPSGVLEDLGVLLFEIARDLVVLDAEDPAIAGLASRGRAQRICWVANAVDAPPVAHHIEGGGPAVAIVDKGGVASICLWDRGNRTVLGPATRPGTGDRPFVESMFVAAISYGLETPLPIIAEGLASGR